MSLEVMLNAAALAFVAAGAHWGQAGRADDLPADPVTVAAAEVSVGLGLVLQVQRRFRTLDMDSANRLRGLSDARVCSGSFPLLPLLSATLLLLGSERGCHVTGGRCWGRARSAWRRSACCWRHLGWILGTASRCR